jgi:hypothetical protein
MDRKRESDSDSRVFIAGLRSYEIVFLPATGEITTWLSAPAPSLDEVESREAWTEGQDGHGWE